MRVRLMSSTLLALVLVLMCIGCGQSQQPDELDIMRLYFNNPNPDLPLFQHQCAQKQWVVTNAAQVQQIYHMVVNLPKFNEIVPQDLPPYRTTYVFKIGGTIVLQGTEELNYLQVKGSYDRPAIDTNPLIQNITGTSNVFPPDAYQVVSC